MRTSKLFWRTDEQIRSPQVRVIGADGKQLGVMPIDKAIERAKKLSLTLVEIAPTANPPVTKIVDFGKFRYQEEKKFRKKLKGAKGGELKEVRFSPFIADNDYNTRLTKVRQFLSEKNKVKLVVVFLGRQMGSKPWGYKLIGRIMTDLGETVSTDMQPKFLGRYLITIISPTAKKIIHAETKDQKITS